MLVTHSQILIIHHLFIFRFCIFQILNAISSHTVNLILLLVIVILKLTLEIMTRSNEQVSLAIYASIKLIVTLLLSKLRVIIFTIIIGNLQNIFILLFFSLFYNLFLFHFLFYTFIILYHLLYFIKVFILYTIFIIFYL